MNNFIFLDTCVFYDCIEHSRCKQIVDRAHNVDFIICTSITVLGETLITMLRQDGSGQKISEFVELIKEWEMHFYVPNDSVRIICYEMGEDHTDSRMAGQITDRTHLAYAIAYGFKYFISTDTLIKSYQLPHALTKYGFRIMGRGAPLLFVGGGIGPPHITIHFHPAEIFFMPGECQPRRCMQSVTKLRLFASPDERRMLFATMERYNAACNAVSPVAFSERQFSNIGLQKRLYSHVRETFGLSAQMAQLAIRKVAGSYRSTKEAIKEQNKVLAALGKPLKTLTELSFREHGAIGYDWPGTLPRPEPGEHLDTGGSDQAPIQQTRILPGGHDRQADGPRLPRRGVLALRDRRDPGHRACRTHRVPRGRSRGGQHRHHERRRGLLQRCHREGAVALRPTPGGSPEDGYQVGQAETAEDRRERTPV